MEEYVKKYGLLYEKKPENIFLKDITFEDIEAFIAQETPSGRLRQAFWKDKYSNWGPEMKYLTDSGFHIGFLSFFFCNYFTAKHAHFRWQATNQITVFETRYRAMRAYMDYVFVKSISTSAGIALKFTSFALIFIGSSKALALANNKTRLTDYTVGGSLAGGLMKMNMGLRGCAVATFLGALLGTFAGLIIYPLQKYAGLTEEERHRAAVACHIAQQRYYNSLLASGQQVPTSFSERRKRSAERIQWVRDFVHGKKEQFFGSKQDGNEGSTADGAVPQKTA